MERHWTCCECEKQVSERYYNLDERMCYECLDDNVAEIFREIDKSIRELHPQPLTENNDDRNKENEQ